MTDLYDLPKDILVKLISTIQEQTEKKYEKIVKHLKEGITMAKQEGDLWECFGCKKWGNVTINMLYDKCYDCVDMNYVCVDCSDNVEFGRYFPYDHKCNEWICKPCIGRYGLNLHN